MYPPGDKPSFNTNRDISAYLSVGGAIHLSQLVGLINLSPVLALFSLALSLVQTKLSLEQAEREEEF